MILAMMIFKKTNITKTQNLNNFLALSFDGDFSNERCWAYSLVIFLNKSVLLKGSTAFLFNN